MASVLKVIGGASNLRQQFREAGFQVPDKFAQAVAATLGAPDDWVPYTVECDQVGDHYLLRGVNPLPFTGGAIGLRYKALVGNKGMPPLFRSTIDEQKEIEAAQLEGLSPQIIKKRSELKEFAKTFAAERGFIPVKSGYGGRRWTLQKRSADGVHTGEIWVDAGGKTEPWVGNQTQFAIINSRAGDVRHVTLWNILHGMEYYSTAQPGRARFKGKLWEMPYPEPQASSLIKLGVMAEIVFFDVVLGCLASEES